MFAPSRAVMLALVMALLAPTSTHAQERAAAALNAGPRLEVTATAMRPLSADTTLASASAASAATAKPVTLMVVGGAAIVLGAVIGDDVGTLFMVGGAVVLLVGLYRYLQ
jgi:hypothetical protein